MQVRSLERKGTETSGNEGTCKMKQYRAISKPAPWRPQASSIVNTELRGIKRKRDASELPLRLNPKRRAKGLRR